MSVTDDFSRYFRETGVEPAAVQPAHVSADNLSWVRQMSTQSYRDTKVQVSGILSPENEASNVTRLGAPHHTGGVPTDSSLWPQSTLEQRKGKFIFRTLVERNFNTQEIAILLMEAYYSKAQVNALLIGKRAVWRLVLMPLTQSGNRIVDSEMVNALRNIMSEVKHVVPTSENISKALRSTGYVQYIRFDSNDVPTPYLPRIATASGVAMAMGMLAGMFKYHRKQDGTAFVDAEPTQSAAFEGVTDERLNIPTSLRWDTVKQNLPQSTPQQMQMVPFDGMGHAVYQTHIGSPGQHRPVLDFMKNAWGNIANMIRVSDVTGLVGGGVEQGDLVWLGFHVRVDYEPDLKIPKFRVISAEDAAHIDSLSGKALTIGALYDGVAFRVGTLFNRGVPAQILPHDLVVVTPKQIEPPTVPRLEYFSQGDLPADRDYADSLVMSVQEVFGPDLPATVSADDVVVINTGLDEIDDEDEPDVPDDDGGGDVRLVKAADAHKYLAEEGRGGLLLQPPLSGELKQDDVLTLNGMPLFASPDGAVMAALPTSPDAPYLDAVEVRRPTKNKIMRFKRFVGTKYADRAPEAVQYTPSLDPGGELIVLQEIPYTAPAAREDASGMRELIAAVDTETTKDTYNATSTQLSAFSAGTQQLTVGAAAAIQSVMRFVGGPDATYDTFTQPESLQKIMHDISPIAWVVSSLRRAIAPPPSEADISGAAAWIDLYSQSRDSIGMLEKMIEESMGTKHHEIAGLVTKPQSTNAVAVLDRLDLPAMVRTQAHMLDERLRTTLSQRLPVEQNSHKEITQLVAREVKQSATVIKYTIMSDKSVSLVERWRKNFQSGNGVTLHEMEEIVHRDLLDNMDYYREEFQLEPFTEQVIVMTKDIAGAFAHGAADVVAALPERVADFCHRADAALDITVTVSGWYAKGLHGVVNLWESAASSSSALTAALSDYVHYAWQNPGQAYEALPLPPVRAWLAYLKLVHRMATTEQWLLEATPYQNDILTDGYNALTPREKQLVLGYRQMVHGVSVGAEWVSEATANVWGDVKSLYTVGIFPDPDQVLRLMHDIGPKGLMDAHSEATGAPPDAGIIRDSLISLGLESAYDKHVGPVVSTVLSYVPSHPRWEEQRIARLYFQRLYYDIWDIFEHPIVVARVLDHVSSMPLDSAVQLVHNALALTPNVEASNYPSKYDYGMALLQDLTSPTFDGRPSPPPMGPHLPHTFVQRPYLPAEPIQPAHAIRPHNQGMRLTY